MDSDKINRWLTLAANIGVLAGIIFLAMELQQNNEILSAQARRDQLDARSAAGALVIANADLSMILFKASNGDTLTPFEEYRFGRWGYQVFRNWEWQYDEYLEGTLSEEDLPVIGWAGQFRSHPMLQTVWAERKANLSPEFVQFVDGNVIGH
jgi:hypothetical protein